MLTVITAGRLCDGCDRYSQHRRGGWWLLTSLAIPVFPSNASAVLSGAPVILWKHVLSLDQAECSECSVGAASGW